MKTAEGQFYYYNSKIFETFIKPMDGEKMNVNKKMNLYTHLKQTSKWNCKTKNKKIHK
jgi:hypothetical protein